MIGRILTKASGLLAIGVLFAVVAICGLATQPVAAWAAVIDQQQGQHTISFRSNGTTSQHSTSAQTVGEFLHERGIAPAPADYVHPRTDAPVADDLTIDYRPAVPVVVVSGRHRQTVLTAAEDIGALLEERGVTLGKYDTLSRSLADPVEAGTIVRIVRVEKWVKTERHKIAQRIVHRIDLSLPAGKTKVLQAGSPGERDTMVRFSRRDYGRVRRQVFASRIIRRPKTRVIAEGVGEYAEFADVATRGLEKTSYVASSALQMLATAYTAQCGGCSGFTASGVRAGHGIVAVDPSVIPLGTRLFIP
ncbi:MAG: ubiquitin-like domain-containing protein, partial [Candidatus Eremiobacteraeota bacterium]|nr:ubiquitin-like domain-containing protein [Candidatus Eremiobacteraeota bacterium]